MSKLEGDVAKLKTDNEWIKETLSRIVPKIEEMHTTFTRGEGKISVLNKAVFGNGKEGIIDEVKKNTQHRIESGERYKGQEKNTDWHWKFLSFIIGVAAIVIAVYK